MQNRSTHKAVAFDLTKVAAMLAYKRIRGRKRSKGSKRYVLRGTMQKRGLLRGFHELMSIK